MIVRIQTGKSFLGAALYHLHDKRAQHELLRLSDERVPWTSTLNTASNIPELAIQEMIAVAQCQTELKRESGQSLGGRPCENPVMTIALSWQPELKPTKDQMIEAAHDFLDHMGWDEHQAIIIPHNDTAHQHVHIILNRIHPLTGLVHDDRNSFYRAENWHEKYDRAHGHILTLARDERPKPHMHHDFAIDARAIETRYAELEAITNRSLERQERDQLAHRHQQEREAFLATNRQQFRETRQEAYREVRQEYRERWVEHYAKAAQAHEQAKQLHRDTATRAMHFAAQADFPAAWNAVNDRDAANRDIRIQLLKERQQLRAQQREDTRERQDDACAELYTQRAESFTAIKLRQKDERAELKELQTAREAGQPYDQPRLAELLSEAPAHARTQPLQEQGREAEQTITSGVTPPRSTEREDDARHGPAEKSPRQDAFDGLAGGIGKVMEIAGDILGSLIAPPTPKEQAIEKAQAQAEAEAAPEREAIQQTREADQRARSTEAQIRAYFEEHAERIAREDDERRAKKRRTRER